MSTSDASNQNGGAGAGSAGGAGNGGEQSVHNGAGAGASGAGANGQQGAQGGEQKAGGLTAALGDQGGQQAQPAAVDYDKLEFRKPDGYKGADSDIARVRALAKATGLTAEQAQKLFDHDAATITADGEAMVREVAQTRAANITALKADAEFGGTKYTESLTRADQALAILDPKGELLAELKEFGLEHHPTLVRAFMRAGRMMAEGTTFVQAKQGSEESRSASLSEFYPTMK